MILILAELTTDLIEGWTGIPRRQMAGFQIKLYIREERAQTKTILITTAIRHAFDPRVSLASVYKTGSLCYVIANRYLQNEEKFNGIYTYSEGES